MKRVTYYDIEPDDESLAYLQEAENLLNGFKDALPVCVEGEKALNRIALNKHFEYRDVLALVAYFDYLAGKAKQEYGPDTMNSTAPWRDAVLRNADNAHTAARHFKHAVDEFRWQQLEKDFS